MCHKDAFENIVHKTQAPRTSNTSHCMGYPFFEDIIFLKKNLGTNLERKKR